MTYKKLVLLIIFLIYFILPFKINAAIYCNDVKDNNTDPQTGYSVLGYDNSLSQLATQFTANSSYSLCSIAIPLSPLPPSTMKIIAYLYSDDGSNRPANLLQAGNNSIDFTGIGAGYGWYRFNFSAYPLISGTKYWIVLKPDKIDPAGWVAWGASNNLSALMAKADVNSNWTNYSYGGKYKIYSNFGPNIIFRDNFDSLNITNCTQGTPSEWYWSSCDASSAMTVDGITHHPSEFISPGRGGTGKAFANWRNGTAFVENSANRNGYWEVLGYDNLAANTFKELYIGFSMKIPPDMNANPYGYVKFSWPPIVDGGGPGIDFYGGGNALDKLSLGSNSVVGQWYSLFDVLRDGQWHFYSYRMKLNTNGNSDGILESWIDGVLKYSYTGVNYGANATNPYFMGGANRMDIGFGNCGDSLTSWQNGWRALEIDDYIVSDSYINPPFSPSGDTQAPAAPSGLAVN